MVTALDGSRTSYRYLVAWGLIASLLVAGLYLYPPFLLAHLDQRVYDVLFRSAQRSQTSGQVVIVDLDERSLARFGRWPWPRGQLARLLEKIEALGAASVGIDMIFAEPDETPPSPAQQASATLGSEAKAGPSALTPNDAALAAVLSRGSFVLGYNLRFAAEREDGSELLPPSNSCSHPAETRRQGGSCGAFPSVGGALQPAGPGGRGSRLWLLKCCA